jgi:hypothetical protein
VLNPLTVQMELMSGCAWGAHHPLVPSGRTHYNSGRTHAAKPAAGHEHVSAVAGCVVEELLLPGGRLHQHTTGFSMRCVWAPHQGPLAVFAFLFVCRKDGSQPHAYSVQWVIRQWVDFSAVASANPPLLP